jgi:tetratricopeptide (TPR) repeat protein
MRRNLFAKQQFNLIQRMRLLANGYIVQRQFYPQLFNTEQKQEFEQKTMHELYIAKSMHAKQLFDEGHADEAANYLEKQIKESEAQLQETNANEENKQIIRSYIAAMYSNLGFVYQFKPENLQMAVDCFKKSLQLNPNDATVYENLALLFYEKLKKPDLAINMLRKGIEVDPDYIQCKHRLAKIYSEKLETIPLAERLLRECVKQNPTNANAIADLAMLLLSTKDGQKHNEAIEILDQLIKWQEEEDKKILGMDMTQLSEHEISRMKIDGYQLKAYALQRLKRYEDACDIYQKQIEKLSSEASKSPIARQRLAEYHLNFAIILDILQKKEEALAQAEMAFEMDQNDSNIIFTLARLLEKNDRVQEAEHLLTELIRVDPRNDVLYASLANIYMESGQKQKAIKLLENAIETYPELRDTVGQFLNLLKKYRT